MDTIETEERRGTSWASATRELRGLRHRIEAVGGSKDQWETGVWHMEKGTVALAMDRGACLLEGGTATNSCRIRHSGRTMQTNGAPYKIPQLMAVHDGEFTQTMRILLSRGIAGIDERTQGLFSDSPSGGLTWLTGGRQTHVVPH